jgi:hypothetical protein
MSKKRKRNKKQQSNRKTPHWYYYDDEYEYYGSSIFSYTQVKPKDIHKVAKQIFGQTYYITYEDLQQQAECDTMPAHEESHTQ